MLEEKLNVGILANDTSDGCAQKGLVQEIVNCVHKYDLDIFLGPEWLLLPKENRGLYSEQEKEEIIGQLAEKAKDRSTLIVPGTIMWYDDDFFYNTTPLISKGKLLGEHHKHEDGGDVIQAHEKKCDKKMYQQWEKGLFRWKDYAVGIEICADAGKLKRFLNDNKLPFPDLYFLVSCGVAFSSNNVPIKYRGYGFYSDGCDTISKVLRRDNDQDFSYITPKKELPRRTRHKSWTKIIHGYTIKDKDRFSLYEITVNKEKNRFT